MDYNQDRPYYIQFNFESKTWNEIYNPFAATLFKTEQEALETIKKYADVSDYVKIVVSQDAFDDWQEWVLTGGVRRTFTFTEDNIYNSTKHSKQDVLDFWLTRHLTNVKYDHYKTWPQLWQTFKHLHGVGRYQGNGNDKSFYISMEMKVRSNSNINAFKTELDLVKDRCDWEEDGYKKFYIFDHELSEFTNYYFLYKNDDDCKIITTFSTKCEGNLEKVFDYWKKERYYEV